MTLIDERPITATNGVAPQSTSHTNPTRRKQHWALWGVAAGVAGFAGLSADGSMSLTEADYLRGSDVVDVLDRGPYHVGIVLGLVAAVSLLVLAAAWRRWADAHGRGSLAAGVVAQALTASAGAMFLGYGFKGSFAVYLDGGIDAGTMTDEGLYSVFMFLDFAPFISWWGVAVALGAVAWLGFRERRFGKGVATVAAIFAVFPALIVLATGLPGIPGVVCPLGLVITSVLVHRARSAA
ncbi:MAG TPA: hypothetical protein VEA78_09655 [Acidimicrobiales bacterium]|nr:hypothetical protein [Acidimicrobiales bacterium]